VSREGVLAHAWIDRDLGWLEFNRRVFHEAQEERTPLLERAKFLAIVASNLDEFFMKRVGLLRGAARVEAEADPVTRQGDTRDRLKVISTTVLGMLAEQARYYSMLLPVLAEQGIEIYGSEQLSAAQKEEATDLFLAQRFAA
jgi:polyphosphate kinase